MRKAILLILLLMSSFGWSQNQANWWFFGSNAGIDFNTGSPIPNNIGQLDTIEGCSAISDACGDLLFYTDGISVWDRNHIIMPNGNGLLGNPSSTQSAIIIPLPNSTNLYYIFSISITDPFTGAGVTGLYYSVVDMNLNNGAGDVINAQKNIQLLPNSSEKLFAAVASNGQDAWIVTYAESILGSFSYDQFYAFKLTPSGMDLSATVTSTSAITSVTDKRGYLKVSPDGSKVAMMTQFYVDPSLPGENGRGAWLFDFDNNTGRVSNPIRLNFPSNYQAYGTEFSLDSNLVYIDLNTLGSGLIPAERLLLQYDTNALNFQNNPVTIYESDPNDPADNVTRGALQIAPNKKIYYARDEQEWLSVINDPNNVGALSNFQYDGLALTSGTNSNEGLPPFYNAFFNPSFSIIEGCSTTPSLFIADDIATCPNTTVLWDFGDISSGNNTSTQINPSHIYNTAGIYTINLIITTPAEVFTSSRTVTIVDSPITNSVNDIELCDDPTNDGLAPVDFTSTRVQAIGNQSLSDYEVSIHNNLLEAENDFNAISDNAILSSGTYFVRIDSRISNGCFVTIPFDVNIAATPVLSPINNLSSCDDFNNDGIVSFDLEIAGIEGLGTQDLNLFDYTFFSSQNDADLDINQITNIYDGVDEELIFVRYENVNNRNCFAITSFSLEVIYQPSIPVLGDLTICDDDARDGIEVFNLNSLTPLIQNTQPGNLSTSFHSSQQNAALDMNPLSLSYLNTNLQETLWVRLENNDSTTCYDVQPLNIEVYVKPIVQSSPDLLKCIDDQVTIEASTGFASYLWNTGENTRSITLSDEGIYTVTVTDINGCQDTTSTVVTNYLPTQIIDIEVQQFALRSNRITVTAIGDEPFEYSIDNFFYQDSNVFTDLLPGYYTVYVRDTNGCDLITALATIIAAPPYFTPNQDGFHDFWQVTAIETEPDAEIYIFDRFGKLLKQLSPLSPGWDGTYLGNPMPSTDYWYRVELIDGRSFKGHFSLKR
ncbi:T9SS type B sorting domain-containing protein [Nonlabens sp.]|uniref:T9SS type B sorting domain-containing protein n=1 Tax=Nonlabens sp. TaxID=1888209 RepID=UPI00321A5221